MLIADFNGGALRLLLSKADSLRLWAIFLGLSQVKTPGCRSNALLDLVTFTDQFFLLCSVFIYVFINLTFFLMICIKYVKGFCDSRFKTREHIMKLNPFPISLRVKMCVFSSLLYLMREVHTKDSFLYYCFISTNIGNIKLSYSSRYN